MKLTPIDTMPQPANVISLQEARSRFSPGRCRHMSLIVDEELATVECVTCGEKLNPVAVLSRFATKESELQRRIDSLKKLNTALDAKIRCKCQHCGQMTRVRP